MDYNKVKPGDNVPCAYCGKEFIAEHFNDETIDYITEADNEWRMVDANTLIELCEGCNEVYSISGVG